MAVLVASTGTRLYLSCRTTASGTPVVPIQVHTPQLELWGLEVATHIGSLADSVEPPGRHLDTRSRGQPAEGHMWAMLRLDCGEARGT